MSAPVYCKVRKILPSEAIGMARRGRLFVTYRGENRKYEVRNDLNARVMPTLFRYMVDGNLYVRTDGL